MEIEMRGISENADSAKINHVARFYFTETGILHNLNIIEGSEDHDTLSSKLNKYAEDLLKGEIKLPSYIIAQ